MSTNLGKECPVLFKLYTNKNYPIVLQCGHTISINAAKQIHSSSELVDNNAAITTDSHKKFICPICRSNFILSNSHVFTKNFTLIDVLNLDSTIESSHSINPYKTKLIRINNPSYKLLEISIDNNTDTDAIELFLVCDISGSMNSLVNRELGLTRLDLVKYNIEMLLRYLTTYCIIPTFISILTFSDNVDVLIHRQKVTNLSLDTIISKVKALQPQYTTNIKSALLTLFNIMDKTKNNIVGILTDGKPTNNEGYAEPDNPKDYINLISEHKDRFNSISIIGYGHQLSNKIMIEIARKGNGVYVFGSDETMISNVFIRWISRVFSSLQRKSPEIKYTDNTLTHQVANIPSFVNNACGTKSQYLLLNHDDVIETQINSEIIVDSFAQLDNNLKKILAISYFAIILEKSILEHNLSLLKSNLSSNILLSHLPLDLIKEFDPNTGQIGMSFNYINFEKWGKPYLYSTLRCLEANHCWNFKDKYLNCFADGMFNDIISQLNMIFKSMPDPIPSKESSVSLKSLGGMTSIFNNPNSTCWASGSMITISDGTECPIQNLREGMKVTTYDPIKKQYSTAKILYVVRQICVNSSSLIVNLGDHHRAKLTPNHPVLLITNEIDRYVWSKNLKDSVNYHTDYVYNLVLSRDHHVLSDGIICVTMGHGMTEEKVIQHQYSGVDVVPHSYFGDINKVTDDCQKIGKDIDGYITVHQENVCRDINGYVTSLTNI